jgi:hypothetical protein
MSAISRTSSTGRSSSQQHRHRDRASLNVPPCIDDVVLFTAPITTPTTSAMTHRSSAAKFASLGFSKSRPMSAGPQPQFTTAYKSALYSTATPVSKLQAQRVQQTRSCFQVDPRFPKQFMEEMEQHPAKNQVHLSRSPMTASPQGSPTDRVQSQITSSPDSPSKWQSNKFISRSNEISENLVSDSQVCACD